MATAPCIKNLLKQDLNDRLNSVHAPLLRWQAGDHPRDIPRERPSGFLTIRRQDVPFIRADEQTARSFHDFYLRWLPESVQPFLVVAGGAIHNLFIMQPDVNDVDYFLVGLSNERHATEVVQQLVEFLYSHCQMTHVYRSPSSLTLLDDRSYDKDLQQPPNARLRPRWQASKVQIILRLYDTLEELLYGFDLTCVAVAMDATCPTIHGTPLAKFSWDTGLLVVDTTRRSLTFEKRIIKYFDRGMDLIFPHLDVARVVKDFGSRPFNIRTELKWEHDQAVTYHQLYQSPLTLTFEKLRVSLRRRLGDRLFEASVWIPTYPRKQHGTSKGNDIVSDVRDYPPDLGSHFHSRHLARNRTLVARARRLRHTLQPPLILLVNHRNIAERIHYEAQLKPLVSETAADTIEVPQTDNEQSSIEVTRRRHHEPQELPPPQFAEVYSLTFLYSRSEMAWTSSFDPIIAEPEAWYPVEYFVGDVPSPCSEQLPTLPQDSSIRTTGELLLSIQHARQLDVSATTGETYWELRASLLPNVLLIKAVMLNATRQVPLEEGIMQSLCSIMNVCTSMDDRDISAIFYDQVSEREPFLLSENRISSVQVLRQIKNLLDHIVSSRQRSPLTEGR